MTVTCIDVSGNNGTIDWPQVAAAGVHIAIAKCSEGADPTYSSFPRNWRGMRDAHIPRQGAYHFALATSSPAANAIAAARALADNGGMIRDDFLALDVERPSQTRPWPLAAGAPSILWTLETLAALEQLTGRRPWLYCSSGWLSGILRNDRRLAAYPLWIANINPGPVATPWPYALRQFTWTARVPGIFGNVDGSELGPAYDDASPIPAPHPGGSDVLIATNPAGDGYITVDPQGHVNAYGGVPFHGGQGQTMLDGKVVAPHTPGSHVINLVGPITGCAMTRTGNGYFLISEKGRVTAFGDAHYAGDPAGSPTS